MGLAALAFAPAAHAALPPAPTAPYTAITATGMNGSLAWTPSDKSFDQPSRSASFFSLGASDHGQGLHFWVTAPNGSSLAVGTYPFVDSYGDATHATLYLGGGPTGVGGCGPKSTGTVRILELTDTSFAADFDYAPGSDYCLGGGHGEVRWNSTIGYRVVTADKAPLRFQGAAGEGIPAQTVTLTGAGSDPVAFGSATVAGGGADGFRITGDTCAGNSIGYGQTCTVTVAADDSKAMAHEAWLDLPDALGVHRVVAMTSYVKKSLRGTFIPLYPIRLVDTREGRGLPKGGLTAGQTAVIHANNGFAPVGAVGAVVLNVTVTQATAPGFVTAFPAGRPRPLASSLNFPKGWTGSNSVTVATGAGENVAFYNNTGTIQLIVDIIGFYAAGDAISQGLCQFGQRCVTSEYHPMTPERLVDTRTALKGKKMPAGSYLTLSIDFGPYDNAHLTAFAVNVTAVNPSAAGYLTTWNGVSGGIPTASTVNYGKGKTVPNMSVVQANPCMFTGDCPESSYPRSFGVYTSAKTDVIVDLFGIYDDGTLGAGMRFTPMDPTRIVDTRTGLGHPVALGPAKTAKITPSAAVLAGNAQALALNVTAVAPTKATYVSAWCDGFARPTVSTLNAVPGQIVPNAAMVEISSPGAFDLYNNAGDTNLVVDVVGSFYFSDFDPSTAVGQGLRTAGLNPHPVISPPVLHVL